MSAAFGPHPLGYVAHNMALRHSPTPGTSGFLLACSSFKVGEPNFVEIFTTDFTSAQVLHPKTVRLPHYYPATGVRWLEGPPGSPELLATSGDHVRIWSAAGELKQLLRHEESNVRGPCTPITGLDASGANVPGAHLATCDVRGICTLWDAERGAKRQALDLGQPLAGVAFGPDGLIAVAGSRGDCFLIDQRKPEEMNILVKQHPRSGPARIAWGSQRPDMFAVAWQGEPSGVALYSGLLDRQSLSKPPQVLPSTRAPCADLQWSPAFPEFLCTADEAGVVELWQFPGRGLGTAAMASTASQAWQPSMGPGGHGVCTALALTPEVLPGKHAVILATAPVADGAVASPPPCSEGLAGGSLWIAELLPPRKPSAPVALCKPPLGEPPVPPPLPPPASPPAPPQAPPPRAEMPRFREIYAQS